VENNAFGSKIVHGEKRRSGKARQAMINWREIDPDTWEFSPQTLSWPRQRARQSKLDLAMRRVITTATQRLPCGTATLATEGRRNVQSKSTAAALRRARYGRVVPPQRAAQRRHPMERDLLTGQCVGCMMTEWRSIATVDYEGTA
jgi:hypothetical protein